MRAILEPFVQICLLRRAPQDLPTSRGLLQILVLAVFLIGFIIELAVPSPIPALLAAGLYVGSVIGLTASLLYAVGKPARLTQTLTALFGVDVILGLLMLPLLLTVPTQAPGARLELPEITAALLLVQYLWSIVIYSHILRHALSAPFAAGFAVSIIYLVAIETLRDQIANWFA